MGYERNEIFNQREECNKGIHESSELSYSQKLLLESLNNLTAAWVADEGKGFVAGIASLLVPFVYHYYHGRVGDVTIGNISNVGDSLSSDQFTFSRRDI